MKNRITQIIGSKYPILLGPMRLISLGEMAAAVSNSGGFGQIAGMIGKILHINEVIPALFDEAKTLSTLQLHKRTRVNRSTRLRTAIGLTCSGNR